MPASASEGSPSAVFPRYTVGVFAVLGLVAVGLALYLRRASGSSVLWLSSTLAAALALFYLVGVLLLRHSDGVQRSEARLRRWFTPPRRLKLTREGRYFIGITLGIGFAAINTGNNLLYLLLGMMLSLILASGVLSEMSLRDVEVERLPPARIEAGRPFLMGINLRNPKARLPSFSIEVEDLLDGQPLDKKCYFLKLPAGKQQRTSYRHQFGRRGRHTLTGLRLSTKFPFGLFRKSRLIEAPAELIVHPFIHPVSHVPPPLRGFVGDESQGLRSRRGEFYGLRDYREGDNLRDVHWRSSARRGRPMVREHEDETARRMTLFVDNALPGGGACGDEELLEGLERAISLAASLAAHYLERGYAVRLVARGETVSWGTRGAQLDRILRVLALLPTVDTEVGFAAPPEAGRETFYVARRGAPPTPSDFGKRLEA